MQACPAHGPHFPPTILFTATFNNQRKRAHVGMRIQSHTHPDISISEVVSFTFKSDWEKESRITGHFPPSSRVTGVKCFAAAAMIIRPTRGLPAAVIKTIKIVVNIARIRPIYQVIKLLLPVKKILSHWRCNSFSATSVPPSTTLTASASKYKGIVRESREEQAGASSEGLTSTVFPADIAPIKGSSVRPRKTRGALNLSTHK